MYGHYNKKANVKTTNVPYFLLETTDLVLMMTLCCGQLLYFVHILEDILTVIGCHNFLQIENDLVYTAASRNLFIRHLQFPIVISTLQVRVPAFFFVLIDVLALIGSRIL